jgi:hypothetical protein
MDAETKIVNGAYRVDAQGDLELISRGDTAVVQAEAGSVEVNAAEAVCLTCADAVLAVAKAAPETGNVTAVVGPLGKIRLYAGLPVVGPRVELDATSITLANGPPGVGAKVSVDPTSITLSIGPPVGGVSIKLGPEKITLQVGTNTYKLALTGIDERVGVTTRSVGFEGHSLESAETLFKVQVQGTTAQTPTMTSEVMAVAQTKTTLTKAEVAALNKEVFGIDMHG